MESPRDSRVEVNSSRCRICEELIPETIIQQHQIHCEKKIAFDLEILSVDKLIGNLSTSLDHNSKLRELLDSVVISSEFRQCLSLKESLCDCRESSDEIMEKAKDLIQKKITAIQNSERERLKTPTANPKRNSLRAKMPSISDFEV